MYDAEKVDFKFSRLRRHLNFEQKSVHFDVFWTIQIQ